MLLTLWISFSKSYFHLYSWVNKLSIPILFQLYFQFFFVVKFVSITYINFLTFNWLPCSYFHIYILFQQFLILFQFLKKIHLNFVLLHFTFHYTIFSIFHSFYFFSDFTLYFNRLISSYIVLHFKFFYILLFYVFT